MENCKKIILLGGKVYRKGSDDKKNVKLETSVQISGTTTTVFEDSKIPIKGFERLVEMRKKGQLCDVSLKVHSGVINAHRLVLAATIPYFDSLFVNHMTENQQIEIIFQGFVNELTMEALINYAYTGKIILNEKNVESILVGASFLKLDRVRDACANVFKKNIKASNALSTFDLAKKLNCQTLTEHATEYINQYFQQIIEFDEFLVLSFDTMKELISRNDIHVSSEAKVFEAVVKWVKHNEKERINNFTDLLRLIRLPLLKPDYLVVRVAKEALVKRSSRCRDLLDEAKDCHLVRDRKNLQDYKFRPRVCNDLIGHIYAVGGLSKDGNCWSTAEVYDPYKQLWKKSETMATDRTNVSLAVYDDKLYVFGGCNKAGIKVSTVEVYFPVSRSWKYITSMNVNRSHSGAATLNDYLYVCGGHNGSIILSSMERYCPSIDKWEMLSNMNKKRCSLGVVAFEGYIFAIGGDDFGHILDLVERYDPITGEWKTMKPMLTQRCGLGVSIFDGKMYVSGGYDGNETLRSVEVYDPQKDTWKFVAPMNMARCFTSLITNMGKLWAIGGSDGASDLSQVEVYDPRTNMWSFATPMCAHKGAVSAGLIAGHK